MLRSLFVFALLLAPLTAHAQRLGVRLPDEDPVPDVSLHLDAPRLPDPPRHDTHPDPPVELAPAIHGALVGQLLGYAFGALTGAFFQSRFGSCAEGDDCTWDIALAGAIAAIVIGPIGAAAGTIAGGEMAGLSGILWPPFYASMISFLIGAVAIPVTVTEGPIPASVLVLAIQSIANPLLMGLAFEGRNLSVRPQVTPIPEGFEVGVAGSF